MRALLRTICRSRSAELPLRIAGEEPERAPRVATHTHVGDVHLLAELRARAVGDDQHVVRWPWRSPCSSRTTTSPERRSMRVTAYPHFTRALRFAAENRASKRRPRWVPRPKQSRLDGLVREVDDLPAAIGHAAETVEPRGLGVDGLEQPRRARTACPVGWSTMPAPTAPGLGTRS